MHVKLTAFIAIAIAAAIAPSASARIPSEPTIELTAERAVQAPSQSQSTGGQDLRSPDTRDSAATTGAGRDREGSPVTTTNRPSPAPAPARTLTGEAKGSAWDTAAIALGGALGLALVTVVATMRVRRRHASARMSAAAG